MLRRFRRAVARTGYAEADLIAPLSAYRAEHGALYGDLYGDLVVPPPVRSFELALSVPAPRTGLPATMRRLNP